MKHFIAIVLGLIIIINLSACKKDRLTANGNITSETRNLVQFTGLSSSGATPVEIKYGTEYSIVIKGSSNIVPHYITRVVNNILYIGFENANVHRDDIEVVLTMPMVKKIELSGSTKAAIKGTFPEVANFEVSISGSGNVKLENPMRAENVEMEISGSGEVDFEKMNAKKTEVDISGSGIVKIQVEDRLKAKISGSGKVYYSGNPAIQQDISGTGKLIKF